MQTQLDDKQVHIWYNHLIAWQLMIYNYDIYTLRTIFWMNPSQGKIPGFDYYVQIQASDDGQNHFHFDLF